MKRPSQSDTITLLYLSAHYNYAAKRRVLRRASAFTRSATSLNNPSPNWNIAMENWKAATPSLSFPKRKRDGVYYTPEKVVNYLVEQTLGPVV